MTDLQPYPPASQPTPGMPMAGLDAVQARKDSYEQLRRSSTWRLLAATKAPAVLSVLQAVFAPGERRLERSELIARLHPHLEVVHGDDSGGPSAAEYVDAWVREGYLIRRDDPHRAETTCELSPATVSAITFIGQLAQPHPTTTESRLQLVVQQFERLADDTETDRDRRLEVLQQRRDQIDAEIAQLQSADPLVPSRDDSADRLRDILQIAAELSGDFLQYREDLRAVDLHLREQILAPEASRGDVLERLLAGDDLLGQSPVGRTFTAFFRMLNDPVQTQQAQDLVDRLLERDFTKELTTREREKLATVFSDLYAPAQEVLDVKTELYRSLARFVRSQDFRQHRVLMDLLQSAQSLALAQKDDVSPRAPFPGELELSRARFSSVSQLQLKDPVDPGTPAEIAVHDVTALSADVLDDLVRSNDIDLQGLSSNVNAVRRGRGQASIASVLEQCPADQGLASIIGLMFLATMHGQPRDGQTELIRWRENDGTEYAAVVPEYFFTTDVPAG